MTLTTLENRNNERENNPKGSVVKGIFILKNYNPAG